MPDNKARRVSLLPSADSGLDEYREDPNGDHHLAHVDHFEVVKKEVWERVVGVLKHARREGRSDAFLALAEIGGDDE